MSCIAPLYDHTPYEANTSAGGAAAMAKRCLIGLVVSLAISVIFYYSCLAAFGVLNPSKLRMTWQMGTSIGVACFFGVFGLATTGAWMYAAKADHFNNAT